MTLESIGAVPAVQPLRNTKEAAQLLGVSASWLKKQVIARNVPCTRIGRSVRFTEAQIAEIIASRAQPVKVSPVRPSRPMSRL